MLRKFVLRPLYYSAISILYIVGILFIVGLVAELYGWGSKKVHDFKQVAVIKNESIAYSDSVTAILKAFNAIPNFNIPNDQNRYFAYSIQVLQLMENLNQHPTAILAEVVDIFKTNSQYKISMKWGYNDPFECIFLTECDSTVAINLLNALVEKGNSFALAVINPISVLKPAYSMQTEIGYNGNSANYELDFEDKFLVNAKCIELMCIPNDQLSTAKLAIEKTIREQ